MTNPQDSLANQMNESITVANTATANVVAARVESGTPKAYRLIRRGDGNGNMIPVLQGLFTWTQGSGRYGAEWRDLETQDEPYVDDAIPFGPITSNGKSTSPAH